MKALKLILKLLPHALIIVACMFITFLIIDTQNKAMEFIDNDISKSLMAVWCGLSAATAIAFIALSRRVEREAARKRGAAERESAKENASDENPGENPGDERLEEALERILEVLRERKK